MEINGLWERLQPKLAVFRLVLEILAVVAVVAYAYLAYAQLQTIQKANDINRMNAQAAHSAALTAASTLETSAVSFRQEERAYVWPSSFGVSDDPSSCPGTERNRVCANVHIMNSGRTPALGVHIYCYTTLGPDAGSVMRALNAMEIPHYTIPSGDVFGTAGDKWKSCPITVDEKQMKDVLEGKSPVYIYGLVQYFDIFNEYHETGFCSYRMPNKGPFLSCDYGNWFDKKPANADALAGQSAEPEPGEGAAASGTAQPAK